MEYVSKQQILEIIERSRAGNADYLTCDKSHIAFVAQGYRNALDDLEYWVNAISFIEVG